MSLAQSHSEKLLAEVLPRSLPLSLIISVFLLSTLWASASEPLGATSQRCRRRAWLAKRCGVPPKIAAKVDAVDHDYFESEIRKLLTPPDVEYIGEISDSEKSSLLSGAIALLAPIAWPEPFGLVLIEAMSCGTPVIAFNRGSVPEIIEDGLTGFVVEGKEEAVAATDRLSRLSRRAIRQRFEERFTSRRMAHEYLAVYRGLIDKRRPRRSAHHAGELLAPSIAGGFADKAALEKSRPSGLTP